MTNESLRQKRIGQQLADLPFSSRSPRIQREKQANDNIYHKNTIGKKKLKKIFYEGDTSERYFNGPPFSLNCPKYEDDYDTIEAHARFCKAKIPGQDIDEFEKMNFYKKIKSDNYVSHYKSCFDQEKECSDLNNDLLLRNINNSSKKVKTSQNLKKIKGSYPSFCKPYSERIKELIEKEVNDQKCSFQINPNNNNQNEISFNSFDISYIQCEKSIENNNLDEHLSNTVKKKTSKKIEFTPNIHVTRRVKSYYIANNMDLPDFLERIDPIPLRYDHVVHYKPSLD